MRSRHRVGSLLLITCALAASSAACGSHSSDKPAQTAEAVGTKGAIPTEDRGPLHAIAQAFDKVAIAPGQRTEIEKLFKDAEARHAQAKTGSEGARKELLLALAGQVEQGKIDRVALTPKIDAASAPWLATRTADFAMLDRLHAILTPLQRGALVDAVEDEHAGNGAHRGRGHGNGNGNEGDGNARGKAQHHAHDRAARWADELALTDAQKDQIKDAMRADRGKGKQGEQGARAPRQHLGHTMRAFREDRFVSAEASGSGANQAKAAHEPSERTIHFMEIAVPVLTPAQRSLAAQKLRERADKKD